jgi:hypothetical protein
MGEEAALPLSQHSTHGNELRVFDRVFELGFLLLLSLLSLQA